MGDLLQPWHLIVLAIVAFLLFGAKRLPELGKGLGEGLKGFKEGLKGMTEPRPLLQPCSRPRFPCNLPCQRRFNPRPVPVKQATSSVPAAAANLIIQMDLKSPTSFAATARLAPDRGAYSFGRAIPALNSFQKQRPVQCAQAFRVLSRFL